MSNYRFLVFAIWLCWSVPSSGQDTAQPLPVDRPLKILLIGNSLTYTNSLSTPLTSFAAAAAASQPRTWRVTEQTMANAKLSQMWALRTTEQLLNNEPWDYIVLQENGNIPDVYPQGLFSAARDFNDAAKKIGAKVVLFENWRRHADAQVKVTELFAKLGKELDVTVAPIGQAWQLVIVADPSIQLREADGVHPSAAGTYIAACVIFLTIANADVCPQVLYGSIDEHVSSVAREAAQKAVANSRAALLRHPS